MKILSKETIDRVEIYTRNAIEFIATNTEESTKDRRYTLAGLNSIREECGLPKIVFPSKTTSFPFFEFGRISMPNIKPKQEEHIHDFMILHTNEVNATICCRACGEVRHIETTLPKKETPKKFINISFEDFADLCDGAASFRELKELLIERMENE